MKTLTALWWRVVKGGEGLEQPFTPIFLWPSATYTVKVKGEGFLAIFFGVHRLLIIKKQCKITKFPPHIQTFPYVFSFKSRDKQRMVLYLSSRGTNIQGHRVRYLGSLFRVDVPVLLISLIIIPDNLSTSGFGDLLWLCTCLLNLRAPIILHLCKKT